MVSVYERSWPERARPPATVAGDVAGIGKSLQAFMLPGAPNPPLHHGVVRLCLRAKGLLDARGLAYTEIALDDDPTFRQRVYDLGRQWTVPLVLVDGVPIGGYRELVGARPLGLAGRATRRVDEPTAARASRRGAA